jgi:hypothetical protein
MFLVLGVICFVLPAAITVNRALAAGRVQLEIVGDAQSGAGMSFQDWGKALADADVKNVRLRSAQEGDKPNIDVAGTDENPIYMVTAVITGRNELIVPGGKFRRSDLKQLKSWIKEIEERGPPDRRVATGPFGLTAKQLDAINSDLAKSSGVATHGMTRSDAVQKISGKLGLPLKIEGELTDGDEKIEEDLADVSSGTALAYILRPSGFCMTPVASGKQLGYVVAKAKLDQEVWPIGREAKSGPEALPGFYEFRNVKVSGVSAAKLLQVVAKQVKVPVLFDYPAMARHGIDPEKAVVEHPQARTTYSVALRRMLFKVGLKFELRVDENDKPFLWISTVKPV